jgi:hypothetical protein
MMCAAEERKYGEGWAAFRNELSKKVEPWTIAELQQLRSAASVRNLFVRERRDWYFRTVS